MPQDRTGQSGISAVFLYRSTEIKGYHTGEDPRLFGMLEFVDVKEDYKQQLRKEILEYYYDNLQMIRSMSTCTIWILRFCGGG
mgnify:CR=1 FL=1